MPDYCAVPLCKGFGGFRFPKDPILRKKWQVAIRRQASGKKLWKPTNTSVVCSKHFQESDFYQPKVLYGEKRRRLLNKEAIPSVFPFAKTNQSESAAARTGRYLKRIELSATEVVSENGVVNYDNFFLDLGATEEVSRDVEDQPQPQLQQEQQQQQVQQQQTHETVSTGTQCNLSIVDNFLALNCKLDSLKKHPNAIKYYTGFLNYEHFMFFFRCLGPASQCLNYQVSKLFLSCYLCVKVKKIYRIYSHISRPAYKLTRVQADPSTGLDN
jgi:hypothetical protein